MIDSLRERMRDLGGLLQQLDAIRESGQASRLPGLTLARTAIAVDQATTRLGKLVEKLVAGGTESSAKTASAREKV